MRVRTWIAVIATLLVVTLFMSYPTLSKGEPAMTATDDSPTQEATPALPDCPPDCETLIARAELIGSLPVIVRLDVPFDPELTDQKEITDQRAAIHKAQQDLIAALNALTHQDKLITVMLDYDATPYLVLSIDKESFKYLTTSPLVSKLYQDIQSEIDPATMEVFDLELNKLESVKGLLAASPSQATPAPKCPDNDCKALLAKIPDDGQMSVIIGLNVAWQPEGDIHYPMTVNAQRVLLRLAQTEVLKALQPYKVKVLGLWLTPSIGLTVDKDALQVLIDAPLVTSIQENRLSRPNK